MDSGNFFSAKSLFASAFNASAMMIEVRSLLEYSGCQGWIGGVGRQKVEW